MKSSSNLLMLLMLVTLPLGCGDNEADNPAANKTPADNE